MPEFLQEAVNGEDLGRALLQQLEDTAGRERLEGEFLKVHQQLRVGAADRAAQAILDDDSMARTRTADRRGG